MKKEYWENRYKNNGNSGEGSHRKDLYTFKLNYIQNLVNSKQIDSVLDYGCGDGNQTKEFVVNYYLGMDISEYIIQQNKIKYNKNYITLGEFDFKKNQDSFDLVLCLDVLFHLVDEKEYLETVKNLFQLSKKYVLIYSQDKNYNQAPHVLYRTFSNLVPQNYSLVEKSNSPSLDTQQKFYLYQKR